MRVFSFRRFAGWAAALALGLTLAACGGGSDSASTTLSGGGSGSSTSTGSGSSGSTDTSSSSGSGSGSAKYYRRTDNGTAMALDGANSYFCSWSDCPSGATCGMKIFGTDRGTAVDWMIPTTANGGNKVKTTFDITRTSSGLTLLYQGSRAGDYTPASSWNDATRGDNGYCGGTATSGGGSTGGTGTGSTGSSGGTTGQIAVFTRRSNVGSSISVSIDGSAAGTLTSYFVTGTPDCGDAGTVTRTLSAGSHSLSATATSGSWGPTTVRIVAGQCLTFELQ